MNQQPIFKEMITLSKTGQELIKLRCMTTSNGYTIYCKSPIIHALFKKNSKGRISNQSVWGAGNGAKLQGYDMNTFFSDQLFDNSNRHTLPDQLRRSLQYWANPKLILEEVYDNDSGLQGGLPNLAFLTADTLNEGVTLNIESPMSQTGIDVFMREAEKLIKYLFNQFCANKSKELAITIDVQEETVEPDFEGQIELDEGYDWIEEAEARLEEVQTL